MSDYREIDGIRTPMLMREQVMGQDIVMRFSKVEFNGAVPAGRFEPPADAEAFSLELERYFRSELQQDPCL